MAENASQDATERADGPVDPEQLGFAGAMAELERIVVDIESDAVDVDLLIDRVERAALLVGWCRERIDATRFRVEEILDRLE